MPQLKETTSRKPREKPLAKELHLHEGIAKKAYGLYEHNGREEGKDVEHWLEAEKLVLGKGGRELLNSRLLV